MGRNRKIPDRWENYSACGRPMSDAPFVAFKVPLSKKVQNEFCEDQNDSSAAQEDPNEAQSFKNMENHPWTLASIEEKWPNLRLVIDLTATYKYYRPKDLTVKHVKILTEGRVVPSNDVVSRFFTAVDEALLEKEDALIGVHCTHGLNRTGYMVCRYLIQKLKWDPQRAIDAFNEARGHKMERPNYIEDLLSANWTDVTAIQESGRSNAFKKRKKKKRNKWNRNPNSDDTKFEASSSQPNQSTGFDTYQHNSTRYDANQRNSDSSDWRNRSPRYQQDYDYRDRQPNHRRYQDSYYGRRYGTRRNWRHQNYDQDFATDEVPVQFQSFPSRSRANKHHQNNDQRKSNYHQEKY